VAVHSQHAAETVREQVSRSAHKTMASSSRDGTSLAFTAVVANQVAMLVPGEGGWWRAGVNH
jgi:hypothetical protein